MDKIQQNPRYLPKILWCAGLVIVLQVLKKYLDIIMPGTVVFHHYLLTEIQVIILLWTIVILLFPSMRFIKKAVIVLLIIAIPELLCTYLLSHPEKIPAPLQRVFMRYDSQAENDLVQYNRKKSEYNKDLFYTLAPLSRFEFAGREFADSFFINRMGLRDDDSSLQKPGIICLGDSYTMGWGVEQNESFAEQLGNLLHTKVLNAGISSYGTPRELGNLYRLDTSGLQYIVLQYCYNDFTENESFIQNGYSLNISSEHKYDSLQNSNYWSMVWFPGKRITCISKFYLEEKLNPYLFPKKKPSPDSILHGLQTAARYFTDIMLHSAINFKKIKVFMISLNPPENMNNFLQDEINKLMNLPQYAAHFNNNLVMVPLAGLLTEKDYYLLDAHINASGHRKVAQRLYDYIYNDKVLKN